jgi:diguanylate cyclase (GGDEF)-like protein
LEEVKMEISISNLVILMLLIVTAIVIVIGLKAHFSSIHFHFQKEKAEIEKSYNRKLGFEEHKRVELQREIETLKKENEKNIYFLISIPEIVKDLVSNLSFEETVSSIFRLVKSLIDPGIIKLYMFDNTSNCLSLVRAYGSEGENKNIIKVGEGVIGLAAENKMLITHTLQLPNANYDGIDIAVPILFKESLLGVIGLGNIKEKGDNEKRFLSMIADLAGISLQSSTYLKVVQREAITDSLTGLYNRRYLFEKAKVVAQHAITRHSPVSVFIFDIDYFKRYNDVNGHAEGDGLLVELSRLIRENSRATDIVARFGGEEFIVIMPDTDKNSAWTYAEKIRKLIEEFSFNNREKQPSGYVSISGGVASFPFDGNSLNAVIRRADEALYESKKSGRNRVKRYEPFDFSMAL